MELAPFSTRRIFQRLAEGIDGPLLALSLALVAVGLATLFSASYEQPARVTAQISNLLVAFVAVAVVSIAQSEQHPETLVGVDRQVIALSLLSGVFFGLFYITLSSVSDDAGLWPITISRAAGSIVLVILSLVLTRGVLGGVTRLWRTVLLIAVLEVSAMVPLLVALQRGPVAIASVLASLYPVTTVLLAAFVLRERLSRLQYVGVACALISVALVSTG